MAGHFASVLSSRVSKCSLIEELGSVNLCWLTMRAADKWESPRFLGIWLALSFSVSRATPHSAHLSAYAGRWAVAKLIYNRLIIAQKIQGKYE